MNYNNDQHLEFNIKVRTFEKEKKRILDVIEECNSVIGGKKYESVSHFIRCAIQRLLKEEERELARVVNEG